MIYAIVDEGELVDLVEGLDEATINDLIVKVDQAFGRVIDRHPTGDNLNEKLCEDLGIPYENMGGWDEVLVAYLCSCGGRRVEHRKIEAVPQ